MANEYFKLINQECHAPAIIGRTLTQDEVDEVVAICNRDNAEGWGEEHLIEALKEFKNSKS